MDEFKPLELNKPEIKTKVIPDEELTGKLNEWYEDSNRFMQPKRERWRKNEKLYLNDITITKSSWTVIKFNLALAIIQKEMSIIADYLPTFDVIGEEENDNIFADMVQVRKLQLEKDSNLEDVILNCTEDSLNLSNGILHLKTIVEPVILPDGRTYNKLKMKVKAIDPYCWLPSPYATDMDIRDECRYQMFVIPMHIDTIKRQYGDKAKDIVPEGYIDENFCFISVKDFKEEGKIKYALIKECYFMDEDLEKYPNGRVIVWTKNTILDDKGLGAIKNDKIIKVDECLVPYFNIANYKSAHSILGIVGDGELIRTQIFAFDQIMSAIADNIKKQGNPIRKIVSSLFKQMSTKILNIPGEIIEVNRPDDVTWDVIPGIPSHQFVFLEWLLRLTETVSGINEVSQGRRPTGISSGIGIAELQEAVQERVRYKIRKELNPLMVNIGKYIVWAIQNYDDEIKMYMDTRSSTKKYVEYNPMTKYDIKGKEPEQEGYNEETAKTLKDSNLEIQVVQGTRLPMGRLETEQRSLNKFSQGVYGIEEVVKSLAEPNKNEIIENYYKRQGLLEMKQRQDDMNKVFMEFQSLVEKALKSQNSEEQFTGTFDEENIAKILKQYPEFLNTDEFGVLPLEIKTRLLEIFKVGDKIGENQPV